MKIDIQRYAMLAERHADAVAAALSARAAETDAVQALREHTAQQNASRLALQSRRNQLRVTGSPTTETATAQDTDDAHRRALEGRVARRKTDAAAANQRAAVWSQFADGLRSVAQQNGVAAL